MTVLNIRHTTIYRYREPVRLGPHRLLLRPRESHDVRLLSSTLAVGDVEDRPGRCGELDRGEAFDRQPVRESLEAGGGDGVSEDVVGPRQRSRRRGTWWPAWRLGMTDVYQGMSVDVQVTP